MFSSSKFPAPLSLATLITVYRADDLMCRRSTDTPAPRPKCTCWFQNYPHVDLLPQFICQFIFHFCMMIYLFIRVVNSIFYICLFTNYLFLLCVLIYMIYIPVSHLFVCLFIYLSLFIYLYLFCRCVSKCPCSKHYKSYIYNLFFSFFLFLSSFSFIFFYSLLLSL